MNEQKKSILLITCFFYPQNRVPVLRVGQWAKYWALQGHQVTVLTTRKYSFMGPFGLEPDLPENVTVVEVPCLPAWLGKRWSRQAASNREKTRPARNTQESGSRLANLKNKVRGLRNHIGSMLDIHDLWVKPAYRAGLRLIAANHYDLIVSSYSPPAVHVVASKLKKRHPELLWFADFRDLWVNNHITSARGIFKRLEHAKERRTLNGLADAIITVSQPLAADLQSRYPALPVWVIENGFDPDEFPAWLQTVSAWPPPAKEIAICYAGTIYPNRRDPTPLFIAVNDLIDAGSIDPGRVSIAFYGQNEIELRQIIQRSNANRHGIIQIKGFVDRQASLEAQRNSSLLLLLESGEPSAKGMLTGKVFEYLVSGIPILAVGIDGTHAAGELLERTGTGYFAKNANEIKNLLLEAITLNRFSFYKPQNDLIANYSRKKQAQSIIDRLTEFQGAYRC